MRRFAKIAGFVVLVGAVTLLFLLPGLLRLVGVRHFRVPAPSMEPAITTGDRIVTTPTSDPERGEIIVFNPPVEADGVSEECVTEQALCARPGSERSELLFVKRVVAREGDRVAMDDGRVVLNGRLQREPYVDAGAAVR